MRYFIDMLISIVSAFGEVYTWGLKECIPLGKVIRDHLGGGSLEKDDEHTRSFNGQGDFYCSCVCFCFKGKENEFILNNF